MSIFYSINYLYPWGTSNLQNLPIELQLDMTLPLVTNIVSLAVSISILAIGIKLRQGKPLGKTLLLFAYLLAAEAITYGSETLSNSVTIYSYRSYVAS